MAGKLKHAERLSKSIGVPIDGACAVSRAGAATSLMSAGIGGAVGAVVGSAMSNRGNKASDITFGSISWLALGDEWFWFVKGDMFLGKPKGEPFAEISYYDVEWIELSEGKVTLRVDMGLRDGRTVVFETKRHGASKPNVEVIELFEQRCLA